MRLEEKTALKCLKNIFNEGVESGRVREFEYFVNGFIASARVVLEMGTLPSEEFMAKLEEIAEEASETMDII